MPTLEQLEQALVERGSAEADQADLSLAHLVGSLTRRAFTGVLDLEHGGRSHTVYFQNGDIVDADPASPEDALGRVALDAGLVDIHTVHDSLQRMVHDRRSSQKDILVSMGALTGDGLEHALRMTLTRRAVRIFALAGATVRIDKVAHGRMEGGPVEPRWIVHRGVRSYYDEERLDRELGVLAGYAIRLAVDPAEISAAFGFSRGELIVIKYLAKRHHWEVQDLVDYCDTVKRVTVLAVVHTLHAFGELDVQPGDTVHRYRRSVREPSVSVPPVAAAESTPVAPVVGEPPPGPAGTRPPLGAPPRRPAASQPMFIDTTPPAGSLPQPQTTALSANQHFMRGELALRREKYPEAIEEFRAAVELDGNSPDYHAFLAWAKWCAATIKDAVLPEVKLGLLKASKLSGNRCVPAFYFRGLIYDARGESEKAYKSFQMVCSLDERHIDAARMMHIIERRQQGSKGLFDRLRRK